MHAAAVGICDKPHRDQRVGLAMGARPKGLEITTMRPQANAIEGAPSAHTNTATHTAREASVAGVLWAQHWSCHVTGW